MEVQGIAGLSDTIGIVETVLIVVLGILGFLVYRVINPLLKNNTSAFEQNSETHKALIENLRMNQTVITRNSDVIQRSNDVLEALTLTMTATANSTSARLGEVEDMVEAGVEVLTKRIAEERKEGVRSALAANAERFDRIDRGMGLLTQDLARLTARIERLPDSAAVEDIKRGVFDLTTRMVLLMNLNAREARRNEQMEVELGAGDVGGSAGAVDGASDGAGSRGSDGGSLPGDAANPRADRPEPVSDDRGDGSGDRAGGAGGVHGVELRAPREEP